MVNERDEPWDGMNGTTMVKAEDIIIGTVPGEAYGYKRWTLPVGVDIRVERLERSENYETVDHRTVTRPISFAISTHVWNPKRDDHAGGGDGMREGPIADVLANGKIADEFTRQDLSDLIAWTRQHHLNDMKAGCVHQTPVWPPEGSTENPTYYAMDHTPKCPVNGKGWGYHGWLIEPLPFGLVDQIVTLVRKSGADYTGLAVKG